MNCFIEVFNQILVFTGNQQRLMVLFLKCSSQIDEGELELNPQEFMTRGDRDNLQTRTNCSPCWRGNAPNVSKMLEIPTIHSVPTESVAIYFSYIFHFFSSVVSENVKIWWQWQNGKQRKCFFHFARLFCDYYVEFSQVL